MTATAITRPERPASVQRTARTAGVLYLILAVCGGFAEFFVRQSLIVGGDAAATASNILGAQPLFRLGIFAEFIGQVAFVLLVLALYRILEPVGRNLAQVMVAFVLVAVTITALNMLNQFAALHVLTGGPYLTVFDAGQQQALAMTFLDLHHAGYLIAQVFFGLWLEAKFLEIEGQIPLVQNTQNDLFAEDHRQSGHTKIDDLLGHLELDTPVLGDSPLRDVQVRHDFDTAGQCRL